MWYNDVWKLYAINRLKLLYIQNFVYKLHLEYKSMPNIYNSSWFYQKTYYFDLHREIVQCKSDSVWIKFEVKKYICQLIDLDLN